MRGTHNKTQNCRLTICTYTCIAILDVILVPIRINIDSLYVGSITMEALSVNFIYYKRSGFIDYSRNNYSEEIFRSSDFVKPILGCKTHTRL